MKLTVLTFAAVFAIGASASAQEAKTEPTEKAVKVLTGTEKKTRKKKVEMCGECGKPETECECHGHKDEAKDHDHKNIQPEKK